MTGDGSGLSQARPKARLFRAWTFLAAALAALPILRTWQLTADADTAFTTLALFAGAAWQIGRLLREVRQRPDGGTRLFALALLAAGIWQLAWVGADDFWFFRAALLLWAAVWLLLAFGWAGLIWGWRVLASFAIWAALCDAPWQWSRDAYQSGDRLGPRLAVITAQVSGWILWQTGAPVKVSGNLLQLGDQVVSVGVPCTALPLAKLLLLLLALATLLLRLPGWRALGLAAVAPVVSFAISVARVIVLAYAVRNAPSFHYWHDPDGGGGGWFTAAGMLVLAYLIARQMFRQRSRPAPAQSAPPCAPPPAGWVLAAVAAALTIVRLTEVSPRRFLPRPQPLPSLEL